jgi:hypothetical protein
VSKCFCVSDRITSSYNDVTLIEFFSSSLFVFAYVSCGSGKPTGQSVNRGRLGQVRCVPIKERGQFDG